MPPLWYLLAGKSIRFASWCPCPAARSSSRGGSQAKPQNLRPCRLASH